MQTLHSLNNKYKDYIATKYSERLGRDYVTFDEKKLLEDKKAVIFREKEIPSIVDTTLFREIRKDVSEWRMLQGRVEYGQRKREHQYMSANYVQSVDDIDPNEIDF